MTKEMDLKTVEAKEFEVINLQYTRAHRYAFNDYLPDPRWDRYYPEILPFFLDKKEQRQLPSDLVLGAFTKAAPTIAPLINKLKTEGGDPDVAMPLIRKLTEELKHARDTWSGLPIHDCGLWNLLSWHASQEAYEMATNAFGFYSTTQNWNAYDTLLGALVDFSVPQTWWKLNDGYEALPRELAGRFVEHQGTVHTRTRLRGLEIQGEGPEAVVAMRLETNGSIRTQQARNVILAMPQRAVKLMDPDTFLFRSRQFVINLEAVTCENACKLFLVFAEPWWTKVPNSRSNPGDNPARPVDDRSSLAGMLLSGVGGKRQIVAAGRFHRFDRRRILERLPSRGPLQACGSGFRREPVVVRSPACDDRGHREATRRHARG